MTLPTQLVLRVLLAVPDQERYGAEIAARAQLATGTVQPLLVRLERYGWLSSRWEEIEPRRQGRPRRRYFRLTAAGVERAVEALGRARLPAGLLGAPSARDQ